MIYALVGQTCSGKSTTLSELKKLGYPTLISYTTRPKRPYEKDGVDYKFVSVDRYKELEQRKQLVAKFSIVSSFGDTWFYGIHIEDIDPKKNFVVIVEPKGYRDLIRRLGKENVTGIYLHTNYEIRKVRGISRGDVVLELIRRLASDEVDFRNFEKEADFVITAENKEEVRQKVLSILNSGESP